MDIDLDAVGSRIATQAATLDAATHALLVDIRVFDAEGGWYKQAARSCAEWLAWRVGWSPATAREHVRVAKKLAELPAIDDALRCGKVSYCKVRAMTRVATPANEVTLLEDAKLTTGAQLEKICRKYAVVQRNEREQNEVTDRERRYVRRIDREDGMVKIEAVLHPEEAALVWAALEETSKALTRTSPPEPEVVEGPIPTPPVTDRFDMRVGATFDRANALVALAERTLRGDRVNRSPFELVITTTRETLTQSGDDADAIGFTSDATFVSAETVRRLACDAGIVQMTVDEHGKTLDVGRRTRTVNAPLKRALEARDRKCRFPGCECRVFLHAHHAKHWANGGETKLENLVLLCSQHHRFVHEYGYAVVLKDGQPSFLGPNGKPLPEAPVPAPLGRPVREQTANLGITAATNECRWDGEKLRYDWIVEELMHADGIRG